MLLKVVSEYRPWCIVCAWDARERTFRDELYEEYKAQRPSMPDALSAQWALLPDLMDGFGVTNLVKPGYEADDILGTLAEEAKRQGIGSIVVTGDRDAMQVVDDDIWVMSTGRGVHRRQDLHAGGRARALRRDAGADPGLHRPQGRLVGQHPRRARGRREDRRCSCSSSSVPSTRCTRRLDEVKSDKRRALLKEHEPAARLSLQLATMVRDAPLEHDLVATLPRRAATRFRLSRSAPSSSASSSATSAAACRYRRRRAGAL